MKKIEKIPDLVERVKENLFEGILAGNIRPGEKLQQERLAEKLGVSRQPVSHALRMLEEQGILTALDARSLTVAEPNIESIRLMMAVRRELDGFAAETAAKRFAEKTATKDDRITVAKIKKMVKRNLDDTALKSVKENIMDDIKFHEMVRELSGNPYIQESLARYVLHHNRFISLMAKDMDRQIWLEHGQIIEAIANGDAVKAKLIMQNHITRGTIKLSGLSFSAG